MASHYSKEEIELERNRIEASNDISKKARELLLEFDDEITFRRGPGDRFSIARHYTLLTNTRLLAERTDVLPEVIIDEESSSDERNVARDAGEALVRHIKKRFDNGYTRDTKISCLRVFISLIGLKEAIPEFDEIFQASYSSHQDATPAPGTILRWEHDVVPLIQATTCIRDKALIAIQWASGCRPMSELHQLKYKQLVDNDSHFIITTAPESKTGERDVRVFVGPPYLRKWLRNHPARSEGGFSPDTPIWTYNDETKLMSYKRYGDIFSDAAERIDISKPINPQHFRASRASILASREAVNQADLENHFGWVRGSSAAAHYVSRFGKETARHIARADGVVIQEDVDESSSGNEIAFEAENDGPIAPIACPSCGSFTPRHREECLWCPTDIETVDSEDGDRFVVERSDKAKEARADVVRMASEGELEKEDLETMQDVEDAITEYPDLLGHVEDLLEYLDLDDDEDDDDWDTGTAAATI